MTRCSRWVAGLLALPLVIAGAKAPTRAGPLDGPPAARPARPGYDPALFRGGSARLGDIGDRRLPTKAELLWRYDFDQGVGDAVVADGVVYLTGDKGTLFAIKADGSRVLWQNDKPDRRFAKAPAVVADRIYLATDDGITALDRADGKFLWDYPITGGASGSSPLVVGNRVLVAGNDGFIHALNADGRVVWTHSFLTDPPPPPPGFDPKNAILTGHAARPGTMASDGATVFATIFDQSRVVAVDAATGQRRWSFPTKGWMLAEPTVSGDDVFVTSQDRSLYCLDKATGQPRWSFPTQWRVESGVAVRAGSVYFGSCDGFFYRVDIRTGKAVWAFETPPSADSKRFPIYCSPLVDGEAVCFGSFDGYFYAVKTADGTLRWKVRPVEGAEVTSSPSTDGTRIFASVRYNSFQKVGANSLVALGDLPPK